MTLKCIYTSSTKISNLIRDFSLFVQLNKYFWNVSSIFISNVEDKIFQFNLLISLRNKRLINCRICLLIIMSVYPVYFINIIIKVLHLRGIFSAGQIK